MNTAVSLRTVAKNGPESTRHARIICNREEVQVLANESERLSAEAWFAALNPSSMPLLAVMPSGEICVCWNSTYVDDDLEDRAESAPLSQRHESSASNELDLVEVDVLEEYSGENGHEASMATHTDAMVACSSVAAAASAMSGSIFLNGNDVDDVGGMHVGHASNVSDRSTGTDAHEPHYGGALAGEGGLQRDLTFPVHHAARSVLMPPQRSNSASIGHQNYRNFSWFWGTPFSSMQRALSSLWQDSPSQMDSAAQRSTERARLHQDDNELLDSAARMHALQSHASKSSGASSRLMHAAQDNGAAHACTSSAEVFSGVEAGSGFEYHGQLSELHAFGDRYADTAQRAVSATGDLETQHMRCHSTHSSSAAQHVARSAGSCPQLRATALPPLRTECCLNLQTPPLLPDPYASMLLNRILGLQDHLYPGFASLRSPPSRYPSSGRSLSIMDGLGTAPQHGRVGGTTSDAWSPLSPREERHQRCMHGLHEYGTRHGAPQRPIMSPGNRQSAAALQRSAPIPVPGACPQPRERDSRHDELARRATSAMPQWLAAAPESPDDSHPPSTTLQIPRTQSLVAAPVVADAAPTPPPSTPPQPTAAAEMVLEHGGGGGGDGPAVATGVSEYESALADLEAIHAQASSSSGSGGGGIFYLYRLDLTSADFAHVIPVAE